MAKTGEPILAAAGGFVIFAGSHYQYGKMIDIDHGNGLSTRYAHANKLLVNVGQLVLPGEKLHWLVVQEGLLGLIYTMKLG